MENSIAEKVFRRFAEEVIVPPDFQGDPETHGIDEPRGGGFSIMQNLQEDLAKETHELAKSAKIASRVVERLTRWNKDGSIEQKETVWVDENEPVEDFRKAMSASVKQAMYWCSPDRTYRLTKQEQTDGTAICPKCKSQMEKEPFTRSEKMFRCPECGFKVPTGKVTTKKIEIEIEPDGNVEVEVTSASRRQK